MQHLIVVVTVLLTIIFIGLTIPESIIYLSIAYGWNLFETELAIWMNNTLYNINKIYIPKLYSI